MADHEDVRSLAAAIRGLRAFLAYAADARHDLSVLPPWITRYALDGPARRRTWFRDRAAQRLFRLPIFPTYDLWQQRRIRFAIKSHRRIVGPWVDVMLTAGGSDPMAGLENRLLDVIRRVDLWSDQIVTLRTLQTMTILDVDHYCRTVWELGRYADLGEAEAPAAPAGPAMPRASRNGSANEEAVKEGETLTALE